MREDVSGRARTFGRLSFSSHPLHLTPPFLKAGDGNKPNCLIIRYDLTHAAWQIQIPERLALKGGWRRGPLWKNNGYWYGRFSSIGVWTRLSRRGFMRIRLGWLITSARVTLTVSHGKKHGFYADFYSHGRIFLKNRYFSRSTVSLSITSNMARAGKTIGRLWSGDAHLCSFNRKYTGLNLFWTNRVFFKSLSVYHNTLCDLPHLERGRSSVWQDCIYQPQTPKDVGSVVAVHSCCQKTPRKSRR